MKLVEIYKLIVEDAFNRYMENMKKLLQKIA